MVTREENDQAVGPDTAVPPVSLDSTDPQAVPVMTGGPWHVSDIRGLGARQIRAYEPSADRWARPRELTVATIVEHDNADANARAIAAVPDLIAAVQDFVNLYANVGDMLSDGVRAKVDRAKRVLAYATGGDR